MKHIKERFSDDEIIGFKFGRLLPIKLNKKRTKNRGKRFDCICDCGNQVVVRGHSLRHGVESCGCIRIEMITKRATKHKLCKHPLFKRWVGMIQRCENKKNKRYKRYGARGISVCKQWRNDFAVFYRWAIKNGWCGDLHIDRKDNNKGYSPDNCRFVTLAKNNTNMSTSCLWHVYGEVFESSSIAGASLGVSGTTIKRWCSGYITTSGNFSPPKNGCYREMRYA